MVVMAIPCTTSARAAALWTRIWVLVAAVVLAGASCAGEQAGAVTPQQTGSPDGAGPTASLDAMAVDTWDVADTALGTLDAADARTPDASDAPGDDAGDAVLPPPAPIRVMAYNVMCSFCTNGDHPDWVSDWASRLPWLRDVITRHDPDLVLVQEPSALDPAKDEMADLAGDDGTYGAVYYHHTEDDYFGVDYPDSAILYRKARFSVVEQGQFWLGPEPDVAFSAGFSRSGALPRLVVFARFRETPSGRELVVGSTHFDNNTPNQAMSAPLALERFAPMAAAHPVIFGGDFNSTPTSDAYHTLAEGVDGQGFHFTNTFDLSTTGWHQETNQTPPPDYDPADRIDHVWVAGGTFSVSDWAVDTFAYGDLAQYPSDHLAITTTLALPPAP